MSALKWFAGVSIALCAASTTVQGCSSKNGNLAGDDSSNPGGGGGDDSGMTFGGGATSSSGTFSSGGGTTTPIVDDGACKGGHYTGTFAGTYDSHIALFIGIPVTGDVNLDLDQEGSSTTMCKVEGEIPQPCDQVFTLQNGTIDGTADQAKFGDAGALGGFPYHCDMTGTLDCVHKTLVDGWIECTYCVGPIEDGGHACVLGNGVGGTTGTGGHFAGPLTATYDTGLLAFVNGGWNGAESLCQTSDGSFTCNDGTEPGPDGGPWENYISDAGYVLGTNYGGSGNWNASFQK